MPSDKGLTVRKTWNCFVNAHLFQQTIRLLVQALVGIASSICLGQSVVQLPTSSYSPPNGSYPMGGTTAPPGGYTLTPPTQTFGTQTSSFQNPYQAPPPTYGTPTYPPSTYPPPTYPPGTYPPPTYPPPTYPPGTYPPGTYPPGVYPPGVYPNSTPNVMVPGMYGQGMYGQPPTNWWDTTATTMTTTTNEVVRLCQGPRFQQTWLTGNDNFDGKSPDSIQILDTDVSLVFACPNFLGSESPLYIIPSYSHHVWDGPTATGFNLPGSAFSAFLDSGWSSNAEKTFGVDLGVRIGVFSAFDAIDEESIRYQGKAMGRVRLTPTTSLRLGVAYLDRVKYKLLPIGGVLCFPTPNTRLDLFFPEPKLSHYCSTYGNTDVWWYLFGYYGGGSWTILNPYNSPDQIDLNNPDGTPDQVDLNNIRVMMGFEFGRSEQIRNGLRLGFVEFGYAFNQELIYRIQTPGNLDLANSFVIRAGCSY